METKNITLKSIAGYEEEKEQARALIDVLCRYDDYRKRGAEVPKGLLLSGDPGVGKTMFAKAIANEANVPIIIYNSEDGKGAESAEKLTLAFKKAKESAPSILFIDELDETIAVNAATKYFLGYESDETRGCLKTLLSEIDGIEASSGVLVIATSNCKSYIPKSLLRSGRLERQISFEKPSLTDRRKIIELYLNEHRIGGIDSASLASKTAGFTGADIKAMVNNALVDAVREKRNPVMDDFLRAIPPIRFGEIKKERKKEPGDHLIYHEIGHMLTHYAIYGEPTSISLDKYGDIEGRAEVDDKDSATGEELGESSVSELLNKAAVYMGGIAGEKVFLGQRYCGSAGDIGKATGMISLCVSSGAFGFDCIDLADLERTYAAYGRSVFEMGKGAAQVRNEVIRANLESALDKAVEAVKENMEIGRLIHPILKKKSNLSKDEIALIIAKNAKPLEGAN